MFFNKRKPEPSNMGFSIPVTGQQRMVEPAVPQPPREFDTRYQQQNFQQPIVEDIEEEKDKTQCSITISGDKAWVENVIQKLNF